MTCPIFTTAVWFQQDDSIYSPEYLLVLPLDSGLTVQDTEQHLIPAGTLFSRSLCRPESDRLCRLPGFICSDLLRVFGGVY